MLEYTTLVASVICAVIAIVIAEKKNRSRIAWATLCFLFPIAFIVLICLKSIDNEPSSVIADKCSEKTTDPQ